MTPAEFERQMARLRTQWANSYGDERTKILLQTFREVDAAIFHDAVTECLMRYRQAPLADEINREVEQARSRQKERAWQRSDGSILGVLKSAADTGRASNPEIAEACVRLLERRLKNEITQADLEAGLALIESASVQLSGGQRPCAECGGSGYTREIVTGGYEELRRCGCPVGDTRAGEIHFTDKSGGEPTRRYVPRRKTKTQSAIPRQSGRDRAVGIEGEAK